MGKKESNLKNIRQRYELIPYYYSLAFRAHFFGEPVMAPPVFYYQNDDSGRPVYSFCSTEITQKRSRGTVTVTIHPAADVNPPLSGAPSDRVNVVKLVVQDAKAASVRINGQVLVEHASESAFEAAGSGWCIAGNNLILAKSEAMNVYGTPKAFSFDPAPATSSASVNFVCDKGFTAPGESIYAVGSF